jgi:hypothetical protein
MAVDDRSMATRLQISGTLSDADLEMYRRKLPLTPKARVNGTFEIEQGRKYSPKGLLPGKYFFMGKLEENQFDIPNQVNRKFWRCETLSIHQNGGNSILDYEVVNISTLLASESVQVLNSASLPIGAKSDEMKYSQLLLIKQNIVEVLEQIKSQKFADYFPVKWRFINKKEFILKNEIVEKTLTTKHFEQIENVDIVQTFKK